MKYGFQVLTYGSPWADVLATARRLEALGYDYLFGHDHLYSTGGDPGQAFFEGWTTLAAWAQATSRISLGLTVGNNTFRNPGVVAKMAATIDHISEGRSIFGLGAGNVELEAVAHGLPWAPTGERLDWLEESLTLITGILAGDTVTHDGPTYHFSAVHHAPLPQRRPLPILIGAEGEQKGLRVAARFADIWQIFVPLDGQGFWRHKDEIFQAHCAALGRDASQVERMIGCKLVIRSDPVDARAAFERLRAVHRWDPSVWDVVWAAAPEQVAEALVGFQELGVGSFLPQVAWPYDQETLERLIGDVAALVDRTTAAA
jgi:alkanesulfonate monooxygenase SsuD/methylene tetrahydromethanopterin reductase-like flavin-dependent oxidoreductase (luciferase family)